MTPVAFQSSSLQTGNITVENVEHFSIPNKNANTYALAHGNRSVLPFINYPSRQIVVKGHIKGSSVADLDTRLDNLKALLNNTKNGNLDVGHAGGTRRYIATLTGFDPDRDRGLAVADWTAIFTCINPFGLTITPVAGISDATNTAATDNWTHTFQGNAEIQLPVFTLTYTTITGGSTGHIKLTNNANGQGIIIVGQPFVNGDIIKIDSALRGVFRNGVEIDYLGSFPEVAPGIPVQFNYEDGFSARSYAIDMSYNPLWL